MAQRLKRWESPRREGRNDKGRGGSARQRQKQKQLQQLRQKLQQDNKNVNEGGDGEIFSLVFFTSWYYSPSTLAGSGMCKTGRRSPRKTSSLAWPNSCSRFDIALAPNSTKSRGGVAKLIRISEEIEEFDLRIEPSLDDQRSS